MFLISSDYFYRTCSILTYQNESYSVIQQSNNNVEGKSGCIDSHLVIEDVPSC